MKVYEKTQLETAIKESHDWTELCNKLGKVRSTNTKNSLLKNISIYGLDTSHFDKSYKTKLKRIRPIISKNCPVCKNEFKTELGARHEKTYCSKKCCNSLNLGNRYSKESVIKLKETFKKIQKTKDPIEKTCEFCNQKFFAKNTKRKFCSRSHQMKGLWKRDEYVNNWKTAIQKRIKSGEHQGWTTRNILSYPEKFFKKVLEDNGFTGKFITNFKVKKRDIGLDCDANYFLDFYFPDIKLDLEIDGKQHSYPERAFSDSQRDKALLKNNFKIYRLKWKSINKPEGKNYIEQEIKNLLNLLVEEFGK